VPFLDLRPVNDGLKAQILADLSDLIDANTFINGTQVSEFEASFAHYCGTHLCVGVASGLDAIRFALISAGIEAEDEVILPANTFVATLEAVTQAGGVPILADVSEEDYNIDVAAAEAAITPRTRVLLPVHLYGHMADMRALASLAARHRLELVEDACQAHGAERDGLRAGAVGRAGAFSFYPGKNLGAMGDAGALVTDDEELASRARALREHGQSAKYRHDVEGYTARLDTIQALVLLHKLPLLDSWNEERRAAAQAYSEQLMGVGDLTLPPMPADRASVWHLYVVRTSDPDRLSAFLAERRIGTGRHYPEPAHLAPAYSWLGYRRGAFPIAEELCDHALSLPMFAGISEEQLQVVVEAISDFFRGG